jgi:tRNA A-37 threonylcarbamoyl transferase component Bud32
MTGEPVGYDDEGTSPRFSLDLAGSFPPVAREDPPVSFAGRYEVRCLLGSGATAQVYRAHDRRLGREVAVKLYERGAVAVEQLRRVRERTIQASIDHPGVVALFDSGADGDRPFLVMQLVDGETLAERLLAGPLPVEEVTVLGSRLAEALAHVHAHRIVHRDLKPANVLLGADGPLITDFGIAHELDTTHITGTGLVTGTAAYLAPEQIVGDPAGPAADVYALGLILLECLTAEREYPGTLAESALARLSRPPRIPAGLPVPLARTIERMTAREPDARPVAGDIARMLHEPTAGSAPAALPVRRRRTLAATGGLAAAGAAVVVAVLLTRPDGAASTPDRLPAAGPPVTTSSATPPSVTLPAATVMAASSQRANSAMPELAAAPRPGAAVPGAGGAADVTGGKAKAKGKPEGEAKGKAKGTGKSHGG